MPINKVVFGDETLIDISADTVSAETLMEGFTAHDKAGNLIVGTATGGGKSYILNAKADQWISNEDGSYEQSFTIEGINSETKISPKLCCQLDASLTNDEVIVLSSALSLITKISTGIDVITLVCSVSSPEIDINNLTLTEM